MKQGLTGSLIGLCRFGLLKACLPNDSLINFGKEWHFASICEVWIFRCWVSFRDLNLSDLDLGWASPRVCLGLRFLEIG